MSDFFSHALELEQNGKPFVVVTMAAMRGHAPQDVGAKVIITSDGLFWGTVGGGKVEARVIADSMKLLEDAAKTPEAGAPRLVTWNLQSEIGMTCGGEVTFLFEAHLVSKWQIVIFGAGHVAQSLCRFLVELDCHVVCVDTRAEWLERLPRNDKLEACHVSNYCDGVDRIVPGADVILMTMGHGSDLPILKAIEKRKIATSHLGVIGSDAKSGIVRRQLAEDGLPREFIDGIVCPLGDKVGNNTPAEIAIGIVSQLLRLRNAR